MSAGVGLVVAALALVMAAQPAAAHAELVSSDPADGDALDSAPERITLEFTEEVDAPGDAIQVIGSSGDQVDVGPAERSGPEVSAELPPLDDGTYVVAWQVTSSDSHPIDGAFTFSVGEGASDADTEALIDEVGAGGGGSSRSLGVAYGIARFAAFGGLALLVGGALFVGVVWPAGERNPRVRRLIGLGWLAVLVATVAGFGLQAAYAVGGSWADTVDPDRLGDVLGTRAGRAWLVRLGLLAVVLFAWRRLLPGVASDRPSPDADGRHGGVSPALMTPVLGVALLATVSFAGHAGSGDLLPLALAADVVHLTGIAFWLGGLALLSLVVLWRGSAGRALEGTPAVARDLSAAGMSSSVDDQEAPVREGGPAGDAGSAAASGLETVVRRFSTLAFGAVVAIVVTGGFLAWRQARSVDAVTDTTYGRLLLTKVGLVVVILAGAAVSRSVVRRWTDRPDRSPGALRRSVGLEALVAAGVLAVTAVLVNTVPAKDALADPTFESEVHGQDVMLQVTVDPAAAGPVDMEVRALTHGGEPTELEDLSASLSLPERSISDLPVTLSPEGSGRYLATGLEIPFAGTWQLKLGARTSDISQEQLTLDLPVD